MSITLTDLHTHILPGVDDGADSLESALQMLRAEKMSGVERVALTPHFNPLRQDLESFLKIRQQSYEALLTAIESHKMPKLLLGAEVRYSPALLELDLHCLSIGESNYLLLELPDRGIPTHVEQVLDMMLMQGIIPILAHVERCEYFRRDPEQLRKFVYMGALAQLSAKALIDGHDSNFAKACLKNGIAQIIASDAHDMKRHKPCLSDVTAKMNSERIAWSEKFARAVWNNESPPDFMMTPIRKGLLGYF